MSNASDFVTLRGGLVPVAAWLLSFELEGRGLHFELDGDALVVGPRDRLTDGDRAAIRRWRNHLCAIAAYEPGKVQ